MHIIHRARIWSFMLLLAINGISFAQDSQEIELIDTTKNAGKHQLHHKIDMINQLLFSQTLTEKLRKSGNPSAEELVARAKLNYSKVAAYMDGQQYLEAGAILDFILRDITASSRIINVPQQEARRYKQSIEKLEAFELPEWNSLSDEEQDYLDNTLQRIDQLKDYAIKNAQAETWLDAVELMETAYQLKTSLIEKLPHENSIVYDLTFESVKDEYQYMTDRTNHFLELVDLALVREKPSEQTRKLVDRYLYQSLENFEVAEGLGLEGEYSEAVAVLHKSINQLSTVLKLLGVKI